MSVLTDFIESYLPYYSSDHRVAELNDLYAALDNEFEEGSHASVFKSIYTQDQLIVEIAKCERILIEAALEAFWRQNTQPQEEVFTGKALSDMEWKGQGTAHIRQFAFCDNKTGDIVGVHVTREQHTQLNNFRFGNLIQFQGRRFPTHIQITTIVDYSMYKY